MIWGSCTTICMIWDVHHHMVTQVSFRLEGGGCCCRGKGGANAHRVVKRVGLHRGRRRRCQPAVAGRQSTAQLHRCDKSRLLVRRLGTTGWQRRSRPLAGALWLQLCAGHALLCTCAAHGVPHAPVGLFGWPTAVGLPAGRLVGLPDMEPRSYTFTALKSGQRAVVRAGSCVQEFQWQPHTVSSVSHSVQNATAELSRGAAKHEHDSAREYLPSTCSAMPPGIQIMVDGMQLQRPLPERCSSASPCLAPRPISQRPIVATPTPRVSETSRRKAMPAKGGRRLPPVAPCRPCARLISHDTSARAPMRRTRHD
eukprot:366522-Chlamydomonas_euryale.AAC.12